MTSWKISKMPENFAEGSFTMQLTKIWQKAGWNIGLSSLLRQETCVLTLSWWRPLLYRKQFIDLQSKPMDWFLYDNGLRHERVKEKIRRRIFQRDTLHKKMMFSIKDFFSKCDQIRIFHNYWKNTYWKISFFVQ